MSLADDRGLWIAMYPTGDGKTKAALLRSALDLREGFLFGMPTMATTDAMERTLTRIGQALGSNGFELIKSHSLARLQPGEAPPKPRDDSDDECCDQGNISWYTTSNRKLVAPYVVATCDQVLTGALAARQLCFRLTGLANRHVILDEIHTYDPYQTELLVELLEWWGATGTRVTLLSATLPTKHLQLMSRAYRRGATGGADRLPEQLPEAGFPATVFVSASPGCPVTSAYLVRRPAETVASPPVTVVNLEMVESVAARVEAHIHWAVETVRQHPDSPIAIVVNTVGDCIEIAYSLASNPVVTDTHEVVCLHSGLLHGHRQAVAQHLEVRLGQDAQTRGFDHRDAGRRPVLVVGTQAIQASLDFDVDFLSTHLAPAPDLLQRMGRAWRFDAPARRTRLTESTRRVHVVSVGDTTNGEIVSPTGSLPYLTAVLRRTHAALRSHVSTNDGRLDVMGFSQTWVDIAYDADPGALLDEDVSIQAEAAREIIETSARRSAADASKALLNTSEGLLSQARRGRPGVTWGQLVNLTHRPDDEDLMRTRHIDLEPMRVLVVDSSRKGAYWDPLREALVPIHGHPGVEALESGSQEPDWLICHQLAVPWNWRRSVALAVDKTLGGRVWSPTRASLRSTRPLDLKELVDLRYHPVLGLVPAGEMDSE
jgi:CRISPR-associated helicase Cas3